jgi:hypothetical protein
LSALIAVASSTACDDESDSDLTGKTTRSAVGAATTSDTPAFGSALVEPSLVHQGDSFTVTPAAAVRPICTRSIAIVRAPDGDRASLFQLHGGGWQRFGTTPPPTFPACLEQPSSDSIGFRVASDFPIGVYLVCITFELSAEGCGTVEVVAP